MPPVEVCCRAALRYDFTTMSIKFSHVDGLSRELATAVGLYEAAELTLDEIDTSILDETPVDGGGALQADEEGEDDDEYQIVEVSGR